MTNPAALLGAAAADALISVVRRGQALPKVSPLFRKLVAASIPVFNEQHSPRYLIRLSTEVLPTHPRYVAAVRARMGTLMELTLVTIWNAFIGLGRFPTWRISINYVTEYPNLYLRDPKGEVHLRIETKALHDEADEGAARFDTPTPLIDASLDALVVIGWRWKAESIGRRSVVFPEIFAAGSLPAIEIAQERDTRFRLLGGRFRTGGLPFVLSRKTGALVVDPGNYGKLNRIVHASRVLGDLSEEVRAFSELMFTIYPKRRRDG